MTMTFGFNTKKLSNRWGQLFATNLVENTAEDPFHSATLTNDGESTEALHAFMQRTIAKHCAKNGAFSDQRGKKSSSKRPNDSIPGILFISEDNAGRSQLASAIARHLGGNNVFVKSVGMVPAAEVSPIIVQVLQERGIDTQNLSPKAANPHAFNKADQVVILGNLNFEELEDIAARHWMIDEINDDIDHARMVADSIETKIRTLFGSMGITPTPGKCAPEFMAA
ncbi:low molecular weight phosphatase family protein [Corynebacterium kutscheri]|uniref:low molecular weight phosphatase family protein n=1 Tax=Corynebacterium kutscheri TaxID=35755 RepID=UPI0037BE7F18